MSRPSASRLVLAVTACLLGPDVARAAEPLETLPRITATSYGGEMAPAALGHGGQYLVVLPRRELVVVITSRWPGPSSTGHYRHLRTLFDGQLLPAFPRPETPAQ